MTTITMDTQHAEVLNTILGLHIAELERSLNSQTSHHVRAPVLFAIEETKWIRIRVNLGLAGEIADAVFASGQDDDESDDDSDDGFE